MTQRYSIKSVASDEYGIVAGAGFVIVDSKGVRLDWPMLETREEAEADLRGFYRADRECAADDASEARGFRYMGAYQ